MIQIRGRFVVAAVLTSVTFALGAMGSLAFGGSTGTTGLYMPQGSAATVDNGDYVTSAASSNANGAPTTPGSRSTTATARTSGTISGPSPIPTTTGPTTGPAAGPRPATALPPRSRRPAASRSTPTSCVSARSAAPPASRARPTCRRP